MQIYGFGMDYDDIRKDGLFDGLNMATVAEIKDTLKYLGLRIKSGVRKEQMVEAVTKYLTEYPDRIVDKMTAAEISVAGRLLAGERVVGDAMVLREFHLLVQTGWVGLREIRDGECACEMVIRDEAARLLRPLIAGAEPSPGARIMQFVDGWAALCGCLPVNEIMSYIVEHPGFEEVTFDEVMDTLTHYARPTALVHEPLFNSGKGDIVYVTPWASITARPVKLLTVRKDIDGKEVNVNAFDPKRFSYQQIIDASVPLFAPRTPNTEAREKLVLAC